MLFYFLDKPADIWPCVLTAKVSIIYKMILYVKSLFSKAKDVLVKCIKI